jgi:endonuclease/exonuclease/phosphatase family metal-dependent hydrolase
MTHLAARTGSDARRLNLLSCNILAGGSVKRYRDYVTHSWKHVLPHGKRANLDGLARVIGDFDLVGLQEADAGSLRSGFLNRRNTSPKRRAFRTGRTSRTAACRASRPRATACSRACIRTRCSTIRCRAASPDAVHSGRASARATMRSSS